MIKRKISEKEHSNLIASPNLYKKHTLSVKEFCSQSEEFISKYFGGAYEISVNGDYDFITISPRCFASVLKIALQTKLYNNSLKIHIYTSAKSSSISIQFNTDTLLPADFERLSQFETASGHKISVNENEILITTSAISVSILKIYAGKSKIILHALEEVFLG